MSTNKGMLQIQYSFSQQLKEIVKRIDDLESRVEELEEQVQNIEEHRSNRFARTLKDTEKMLIVQYIHHEYKEAV